MFGLEWYEKSQKKSHRVHKILIWNSVAFEELLRFKLLYIYEIILEILVLFSKLYILVRSS